ncbi:Beauvericin cluster-specific repressor BEA4 [Fusarium oxysporum f. sp. rapae]|uniref:Beauvericin cluster-specific repressor BEA4 n=1 Tax=Fusarium oxysporum f. sp. rapae TaxID=485398 RepID=A0A8J5NFM7_FUSOX|nr:Beauvericin cluster-specific repressor BEA4 [Fusarium oxysporum f. sp. rapae]
MKSMAASCLARDFTELHSVAITERSKAYDLLNSEAAEETSDGCLLAIMLLGQTKSWRDPIDLAIDDLQRFRRILRQRQQDPRNQSNLDFFNGCLQYWEMLLSYVTDRPGLDTGIGRDFRNASNSAPPSEPHPFSGISQRLMHVLFDLGKLIFRVCITPSQPRWATEDYAHECIAVLNSARCLENTLLNYVPKRSPVTDGLGGSSNRTNELCELDRVYRYVGLMHLYRVFPDLLNARYRPWRLEDLLHPQTAIKVPTEMERREWLTELALHVLTCLQRLPFESRTISAQPWLLVAAASELRLRQTDRGTPSDASLLRVTKGRKFITSRLFAYAHMLPLQKIGVIIRLVEVIWSEFDAGKLDTFWVDIAYRQQLGTIMG